MQINKKTFFNVTYTLFSIAAIISSFLNLIMVIDILFKISALILLLLSYVIQKRSKTKIIYVLFFLLLAYSNSLIFFGELYLKEIIIISAIEKIGLIIFIINKFQKKDLKSILTYNLLLFSSTGPLYYFFSKAIPKYNNIIFVCYILTCMAIALSYSRFIKATNKKIPYYFLAILLFSFAEVFFGIFFYFDKSPIYIAGGFFIHAFARYTIYNFMLEKS